MFSKALLLSGSLAALSLASVAHAQANVALASQGATFVTASSAIDLASQNGTLAIMQNDPIADTPTPWLADGDTRYIFGTGDATQTYEIKLGAQDALVAFSASFSTTDRSVTGPFTVETSTDGVTFTPVVGATTSSVSNGVETLTLASASAVGAEYVQYGFGPEVPVQYGDGGSGVSSVTADVSAAPEPATWALMIVGLGGMGLALRQAKRKHGFTFSRA